MPRGGGGVPRSAKEANNPILLKVQSLQLSFRPAGVSLGGGGGGAKAPPGPPPAYAPDQEIAELDLSIVGLEMRRINRPRMEYFGPGLGCRCSLGCSFEPVSPLIYTPSGHIRDKRRTNVA